MTTSASTFLTLTGNTISTIFGALNTEVFTGITFLDIFLGAIAIEIIMDFILWFIGHNEED